MIGTTLGQIRQYVDTMAVEDGDYYVVCSQTGEQPIPVSGKRFVSRSSARSALGAAEQYGETLRRYDPAIGFYDLIVCEGDGSGLESGAVSPDAAIGDATPSDPPTVGSGDGRPRADSCHDVAAALFEALVPRRDDGVEEAILEAYLERAERVADPDELCLRLLEVAATEIDRRLSEEQQQKLLDDAASRLSPTVKNQLPIERTLEQLESTAMLGEYHVRRGIGAADPTCSITVVDYALDSGERRVPTLPLAIGLRRRYPGAISIHRAVPRGGRDWQIDVDLAYDGSGESSGLFRAPVAEP